MLLRAALLLLVASQASAASFDCKKAATAVEQRICSIPELSKMDDTLAELWKRAVSRAEDPSLNRASQRGWLSRREECQSNVCIEALYERRIAEFACEPEHVTTPNQAALCGTYQLKVADRDLSLLNELRINEVAGRRLRGSDVVRWPEAQRLATAELQAWRTHRSAKCLLQTKLLQVDAAWTDAKALECEIAATESRLDAVRDEANQSRK